MQFLISVPQRLFPSRMYFWFWLMFTASSLGTWIHEVASSWYMTSQHTEAVWTGVLQASAFLPFIFISPIAGALADRLSLRTWLIMAQSWCFLIALVLGGLAMLGGLTAEWLVVLTLLLSIGAAASSPVFHALLPHMVDKPDMPSAVATYYMGANIGRAVGPVMAGVIIGTMGVPSAFLLNAISFVGIILFLFAKKPGSSSLSRAKTADFGDARSEDGPQVSILRYLREGFQHAWDVRPLRTGLQEIFFFTFCGAGLWSLLPILCRFDLHMNAVAYGHLLSWLGVGAVSTGLLLGCFIKDISIERTLRISILVMASAFLMFGFARWNLSFAASFIAGVGWIGFVSLGNGYLQAHLTHQFRSRVMAIYVSIFFLGLAIGSLLWSRLADGIGADKTFWMISLCLFLQAVMIRLPRLTSAANSR